MLTLTPPGEVARNVKVQAFAATGIGDFILDLIDGNWSIAQITLHSSSVPCGDSCRQHERQPAVFQALDNARSQLALVQHRLGGHASPQDCRRAY
jgi:hypothetical protein